MFQSSLFRDFLSPAHYFLYVITSKELNQGFDLFHKLLSYLIHCLIFKILFRFPYYRSALLLYHTLLRLSRTFFQAFSNSLFSCPLVKCLSILSHQAFSVNPFFRTPLLNLLLRLSFFRVSFFSFCGFRCPLRDSLYIISYLLPFVNYFLPILPFLWFVRLFVAFFVRYAYLF